MCKNAIKLIYLLDSYMIHILYMPTYNNMNIHVCKNHIIEIQFPMLYIQIISKYCVKLPNYHLNINITKAIIH